MVAPVIVGSCSTYPEKVVTRTRRSHRIILVALIFVASYILGDILNDRSTVQRTNDTSLLIHSNSTIIENDGQHGNTNSKIHIFYNLYTKGAEDEQRVRSIVEEQFNHINPAIHDTNVSITSIGYKLSSIPNNISISQHYNEGGEDLTLHAVWEYCKAKANNNNHHHHDDTKVIYMHSKGSYHPNENNNKLRNFVTQGALSSECATLPHNCNVCSSRMSPLPHPHSSGNMWLARCDYISKLINPLAAKEGQLPPLIHEDNPCKGRGRYLGEHWVHSHPTVLPCDLYPGKEFTWAHLRVPTGTLQKDLMVAPRFTFQKYVLPGMCMEEYPETLRLEDFIMLRKQNYKLLYNVTELEEDWWGWTFLKRTVEGT